MTPIRSSHFALIAMAVGLPIAAAAQSEERPNILVIWGDDIGLTNISYNNRGLKRPCHEERRPARVYVIIRDLTPGWAR